MAHSAKPSDVSCQLAYDAHRGTSFVPEKRALQEQAGYVDHIQAVHDNAERLAATDAQRAILDAEVERYRVGYLRRLTALLSAESRIVSSMIAGPSNFPVERMRKRGATADKRRAELLFDAIPAPEIRERLKSAGWRWSPSAGAWQRQNTNAAIWSAKSIMGATEPQPDPDPTPGGESPQTDPEPATDSDPTPDIPTGCHINADGKLEADSGTYAVRASEIRGLSPEARASLASWIRRVEGGPRIVQGWSVVGQLALFDRAAKQGTATDHGDGTRTITGAWPDGTAFVYRRTLTVAKVEDELMEALSDLEQALDQRNRLNARRSKPCKHPAGLDIEPRIRAAQDALAALRASLPAAPDAFERTIRILRPSVAPVPVESSNLSAVGYDPASQVLTVQFRNGSEYRYRNVPPELHVGLMAAESKGSYFAQHVKAHPDRYPFERVREATPEFVKVRQSSSAWGEPYGEPWTTDTGAVATMRRKGQRVRWYGADGEQIGPEQSNVGPACAYALAHGWTQEAPAHTKRHEPTEADRAIETHRAAMRAEIERLRAENERLRARQQRRSKVAA